MDRLHIEYLDILKSCKLQPLQNLRDIALLIHCMPAPLFLNLHRKMSCIETICPTAAILRRVLVWEAANEAHWANSMGDPRVLSNFLYWLIWCCFQCLKVGGAYIWKVPTFSNSFVLSEGNKEHIKRP